MICDYVASLMYMSSHLAFVISYIMRIRDPKTTMLKISRSSSVIMQICDPKTTALIFALGKMVVTGVKSEDDSRLASRMYTRIVQKLGFNAKFYYCICISSWLIKLSLKVSRFTFCHSFSGKFKI
jgi:hypothetical protein